MISRLRGTVIENHGVGIVVDCHGVGYEVQVPSTVAFQTTEGADVDLYVRQVFREDDQALYGFLSANQRATFDLLRDVKGCGPKTSLSILSELGDDGALSSILAQDVKGLTRASGVGPRLAERIIVELKDKVPQVELDRKLAAVSLGSRRPVAQDELVDALLGLGYRRTDAEAVADDARAEADDVPGQIRAALKRLAR